MKTKALLLTLLVLGVGLIIVPYSIKDRVTIQEVRAAIDGELNVGAAPEEIELFLTKHGFEYSYDKYAKRYQAIIRNISRYPFVDKALQVRVNTDDAKRYMSADVYVSYTFL